MEIIGIHEPYLYSIKFDGEESDEYNRLIEEWTDVSAVYDFLDEHREVFNGYMSNYYSNIYEAAEKVADEADELEQFFEELKENAENGDTPDYSSYFKYLDGNYKFDTSYIPVKGYGLKYSPTLIRLYAVRIKPNFFVIAAGGIKLGRKIKDSPGLKENVIKKIDKVRNYLSSLGITEAEDID